MTRDVELVALLVELLDIEWHLTVVEQQHGRFQELEVARDRNAHLLRGVRILLDEAGVVAAHGAPAWH